MCLVVVSHCALDSYASAAVVLHKRGLSCKLELENVRMELAGKVYSLRGVVAE